MKLIGATPRFIRGPFLVSGILYGVISALAVTAFFFPVTWLISPKIQLIVPEYNLFQYYLANLVEFFAIMLFTGISLGVVSSFIAMRRYLRV